jgi:Family of unknown function (DUF6011)
VTATIAYAAAISAAATEPQKRFLRSLLAERVAPVDPASVRLLARFISGYEIGKRDASWCINMLQSSPRKPQEVCTNPDRLQEAGTYLLDGKVFRVRKGRTSGSFYAQELVLDLDGGGSFAYRPNVARTLRHSHKMTLAQACEYGAQFGVCCRCAASLTDPASIARGVGPYCATKF